MTRATRAGRRGGAALEFALILPPLLLLTLPIIDFTWYFLTLQQVEATAQSAVRPAAQTRLVDDPAFVAADTALKLLDVALPCCADEATIRSTLVGERTVRLEIRVPYTSVTHFIEPPPELVAVAQMTIENP